LDVPSSTVVLPIVIVGGNKQVQEVVRSYVNLIEECGSTQILGGVRIEFYVLPSKPCALASFLAAHDPWYRRNLFVPISTPAFLVPWPQDDNAKYAKAGEDSSICPPGKMLKYALDTMVRFSRNVTEIQVFKIDIWKEPRSSRSDMQSITIPFVARVEMGVRVAAAKVEEAKIKAGADAKENIAKNLMSDAKWLAALELPRLSVDFVAVGLSDNSDEQKEQVSATSFTELSVCNIHSGDNDRSIPSNPCDERLELFALQDAKGALSEPQHFFTTTPNNHVAKVEVYSSAPFDILVDDHLLTEVRHISISKLDIMTGPMKIPVMSMIPLLV